MMAKRPYDSAFKESNGRGKWQKSSGSHLNNQSLKVAPGTAVFRVLCPASKTGGIIGKGGSIISHIRQETNAKVRVEEAVHGCDERVILITGSDKETDVSNEVDKHGSEETDAAEKIDDTKEVKEDDEGKEAVLVEDVQTERRSSSAQKALLLVFEKMIEGDTETNEGDEEKSKLSSYTVRLLVLSNQVGCLLGKGGSMIKQMSSESGAQIRILPRDKLPACASSSDELVQITGGLDATRKALQLVSQQLLDNPPRDPDTPTASSNRPSSHSFGQTHLRPELFPPPNFPGPSDGIDYCSTGRRKPPQDILTFRLLCHSEKVGGVIGKGGTIIKTVQLDTGCEIQVQEGVADSEDRVIIISGPAHPDDRISAAQEAVLRVQSRIFKTTPDNFDKTVAARLLVASSQIGCLLGRGGSIIAEMRQITGAHIRILGKDQIPKCALENEEVVQISGEFETVQEALLQITSRLRHHFFRDMFPAINQHAFPDQVLPFPSYMGRREHSPPGIYSNLGRSFYNNFDAGVLPPHGGFHAHDDRPPFMHNIHRPVLPHNSERKQSSATWGPQGLSEGGGPLGLPDYAGVPQRRIPGFGGGSQPAIITNTTVDVVVPRSIVPAIYGEDGESLKQIRKISDAKITITEAKPGSTETVIIISGTPEQTHAAQSLIQAFVMCGPETS